MKAESPSNRLRTALLAVSGFVVVAFGFSLRFDSLEVRPVHADEAAGARILADRLENGSYHFDPVHFHGPLLTAVSAPIARMRGERSWETLTAATLRMGPALAGGLTVLIAFGFHRWMGAGAWAAAAFVATSPILVYYSRMFIHETLFGLLAASTALALCHYARNPGRSRAVFLGLAAGLLMVTRETFVICFFAWAVAGLAVYLECGRAARERIDRAACRRVLQDAGLAGLVAMAIVAGFFTDFGSRPAGFLDFFRTFFVYETVAGHEKPFGYYARLLLWPKHQGGVWWTEGGIVLAGILGYAMSFSRASGPWIRFLFYAAIVQGLVYSTIAYKTPWLSLVAWLHLCLVAGAGVAYCLRGGGTFRKIVTAVILLGFLWWHIGQTGRATGRYASDVRNPYAYVPTAADAKALESWLLGLAEEFPDVASGPVAVIGTQYWPLPWYLRDLPATGYWPEIPDGAERFPVLLVLPDGMDAAATRLETTHTALPRGLRTDTRVFVFVRNDLWSAYLNDGEDDA